ncbi:helix-turn-helix domain-containing protein [Streptomyces gardneri]|uniref:helix-turn-helix domain-containing protein n=1 Tax=Streptomyces gardneri TaxID=66892 RepID=UPI0035DE5F54
MTHSPAAPLPGGEPRAKATRPDAGPGPGAPGRDRSDRREAPRPDRQDAPRPDRQDAPRPDRQDAPRPDRPDRHDRADAPRSGEPRPASAAVRPASPAARPASPFAAARPASASVASARLAASRSGSPRSGGAHTPLGSDAGSGALRRALSTTMLADVDRLTDRAVDDIRAHSGTYAADAPVTRDDLWEICRDNLLRALEDFGGLAPTGGDFERAARETGRRRAEQGVPLDTVLQAYRRGGRVLWQVMAEHLRARAGREADSRDVELDMASGVWETIDRYSVAMADEYRLAQLELQSRQDTRRVALFEALLDGRADDPAVASAAAAALGVPAYDRYVVVVAAQDPAAPPHPAPVLEARGMWSFWRPRSGRYAGIVRLPRRDTPAGGPAAGPRGSADPAAHALLDVLRELTGATAGISPEFERLSHAGRALRLAEQTLRTLPAGSGEAAAFDDRLAQVLLSGRSDIAERIVTVHLGPVLATGGERAALLTTLRVWLDHGCSAARAAELLYCHRNTVLNRIGRIAELTGRSSESGEARLGWALALRALPYAGLGDSPEPAAGEYEVDGT